MIQYKDGAIYLNIEGDWQDKVATNGNGKSYRAEILLQKKNAQITGWIGCTLSSSTGQFDELNSGKNFRTNMRRSLIKDEHDTTVYTLMPVNDPLFRYRYRGSENSPMVNDILVIHPTVGELKSLLHSNPQREKNFYAAKILRKSLSRKRRRHDTVQGGS